MQKPEFRPEKCGLPLRRLAFCILHSVICIASVAAAPADSIVAVVGEQAILESDLEQAANFVRIAGRDTVTADSTLRREVLDQLISNELLQVQAQNDTIDVTREEIQSEVDANIAALRQRFDTDEQYQAALAAEGVTERSLRSRYEEDARRQLLSRKLLEKEGLTRTYVSPTEAERFYNERRDSIAFVPGRAELAHILIPVLPAPQAESTGMRRAAEVLDVLSRGGDFATVARSFSDDRKTADLGGDWGWRGLEELTPDLAMVLVQLKPGQVSPPFRGLAGYLVLRLDGVDDARVRFRSILLRVPTYRSDTARALAQARAIRDKALAGAAFDSLARELSRDPATRDSGGYLGAFMLAGLTPPFDTVVPRLDSGAVSEPVLSEHGFHILKVLALEKDRTMTYLEMQDMIRNYLSQQKVAVKLEEYIARLEKKTFVQRFD